MGVIYSLTQKAEWKGVSRKRIRNILCLVQLISKNIIGKLQDIVGRRDEFKDESDRLFHREYERYT